MWNLNLRIRYDKIKETENLLIYQEMFLLKNGNLKNFQ